MLQQSRKSASRRAGLAAGFLLSGTAVLALAGCGGSGYSNNGANNNSSQGEYRGVYLNSAGPGAPDAGTLALIVDANGGVTGTVTDVTGGGATGSGSGSISNSGAATASGSLNFGGQAGIPLSGNLALNATTHQYTGTLTSTTGISDQIAMGPALTQNSPLASFYGGTLTGSDGVITSGSLTIAADGRATGNVSQGGNAAVSVSGYVDANGILYLVTPALGGRGPEISVGQLTLSGHNLTGTLQATTPNGTGTPATRTITVAMSNLPV